MARDNIHYPIKNALIKDGWTILADPYRIEFEDKVVSADLRAEKLLRLSRGAETIVVEIKSFIGRSFIKELQNALGQYQMYSFFLTALEREEPVYLAISSAVFDEQFHSPAVRKLIEHFQVRLLVIDIQTEEVTQWIT